jgi:hypothetical protein
MNILKSSVEMEPYISPKEVRIFPEEPVYQAPSESE